MKIKYSPWSVIKWETFIRKCFEKELFPLGEKRKNTLKNGPQSRKKVDRDKLNKNLMTCLKAKIYIVQK